MYIFGTGEGADLNKPARKQLQIINHRNHAETNKSCPE